MMHVHINCIAKTHHSQGHKVQGESVNQRLLIKEHATYFININSQKWVFKADAFLFPRSSSFQVN